MPCPALPTLPRCEYLPAREVSEKLLGNVYYLHPGGTIMWPRDGVHHLGPYKEMLEQVSETQKMRELCL